MARPLRIQFPGAVYHVTNRGNERKNIFQDDADRNAFLKILSESIDTYGIILHSFVLMNNHWHLLVQTPLANLSEFMRHFNITYTSHFNRRHHRVGHLYQGRYRSLLVEEDAYLCMVSRYIHINPVKTAIMRRQTPEKQLHHLWNYHWSSLPGYVDFTPKLKFVEYATVLAEYKNSRQPAEKAYQEQLTKDLIKGLSIHDRIVGQSILGSESFIAGIKETHIADIRDRERPAVGRIHQYLSIEKVLAVAEKELNSSDLLRSKGMTRQIVMTLLYKYAGLNNRQIAELLNLDYSTVSQGRKRLRDKVEEDIGIQTLVERIIEQLARIKI